MLRNKKEPNQKKRLSIILASALVIALLGAGIYYTQTRDSTSSRTEVTDGADRPVDLSPATDEDKIRSEQNKQEIVDKEKTTDQPATPGTDGTRKVTPVITYAGRYGNALEVGGYIDIFEEGGTCTATFTKNDIKITRSVEAIRDAKVVNCPTITVESSAFTQKGTYRLTLDYQSDSVSGSSEPRDIEVQ